MNTDWAQVKTGVERGLHAAESGERGGIRVHCGSVERMLKGAKDETAQTVLQKVHRAKTAIDVSTSVESLKEALALIP